MLQKFTSRFYKKSKKRNKNSAIALIIGFLLGYLKEIIYVILDNIGITEAIIDRTIVIVKLIPVILVFTIIFLPIFVIIFLLFNLGKRLELDLKDWSIGNEILLIIFFVFISFFVDNPNSFPF